MRMLCSVAAIFVGISVTYSLRVAAVADPVVLDASNFSSTISNTSVVLVMFSDKKCGICVDFAPKYAVVARELPKVPALNLALHRTLHHDLASLAP